MEQEMDEGPKRTLGVIAAISACQEGDATTQRLIAVSLISSRCTRPDSSVANSSGSVLFGCVAIKAPPTNKISSPTPPISGPGKRVPPQRWMTFVRNHAQAIVAYDFFIVVTASFRVLHVFVLLEVATRRIVAEIRFKLSFVQSSPAPAISSHLPVTEHG